MERASVAAASPAIRRPARLLRLASDERLVLLVRAGDDAAFEALYDRHHGAILGFCRHMLGTREEAEDALQHTFMAAFRDLVGNTKPIELRPWLFAIARNRCLSLLRARRPHVALELAEPATDGLAATVERREDVRELLADLARLPEDQRSALLLAELGALDHAGIATVLGCPREKVKALVFQARSSLAASREARATPCERIRLELATASGGALRRGPLRRHLRACAGCRAFKAEVATQRSLLALALPVVPGVALKASVLAGVGGAHGGAGTAAGTGGAGALAGASGSGSLAATTPGGALGGLMGGIGSSAAAKVTVSVAVVGAVASGSAITVRDAHQGSSAVAPTAVRPGAAPTTRFASSSQSATAHAQHAPRRQHTAAHPALPQSATDAGTTSGATAAPRALVLVAPPAPGHAEAGVGGSGHTGDELPAPGQGIAPKSQGGTPPGQGGTPPGQSGTAPGQSGTLPAPGGTPPGQGATPPGQSGTPPGQGGTPPGQGGTPPGQAKTPPGQGGTPPGQAKTPPGQGGTPPGQAKKTPPGQGGTLPGQSGTPPGQGGTPPGQGGTPPGQAKTPPGQGGTPPGQANTPPGQGGTPPGQANVPPGQGGTPPGQAQPPGHGRRG